MVLVYENAGVRAYRIGGDVSIMILEIGELARLRLPRDGNEKMDLDYIKLFADMLGVRYGRIDYEKAMKKRNRR
jgi:hypothetical protein